MSDGSCFFMPRSRAVPPETTGTRDDLRQYFRETIEPTQNFPS